MRELLSITKALADENRLRIVAALEGRELCLCQLVELLGLATSTVSKHASILQQSGLVTSRKQGRWNYFRLDEDASSVAAEASELVRRALKRDRRARDDRRRLKEILKLDPEQLCRQQSACKC